MLTSDEAGNEIVAHVHVKLGDDFVVMLPNGQLVARKADDVKPTERRFQAADADDIAGEIMRGPWANFQYRKTKHYIFIYNTTDGFAEVTKSILESMYKGVVNYFKNQRFDTRSPKVPLVVIMFNREAQFQAFRRMPPRRGRLLQHGDQPRCLARRIDFDRHASRSGARSVVIDNRARRCASNSAQHRHTKSTEHVADVVVRRDRRILRAHQFWTPHAAGKAPA